MTRPETKIESSGRRGGEWKDVLAYLSYERPDDRTIPAIFRGSVFFFSFFSLFLIQQKKFGLVSLAYLLFFGLLTAELCGFPCYSLIQIIVYEKEILVNITKEKKWFQHVIDALNSMQSYQLFAFTFNLIMHVSSLKHH